MGVGRGTRWTSHAAFIAEFKDEFIAGASHSLAWRNLKLQLNAITEDLIGIWWANLCLKHLLQLKNMAL